MRKYRTIQGDTWDMIAYREYRDEKQISVLIQANESYSDYVIFPAGIILDVPELEENYADTLPPWKK